MIPPLTHKLPIMSIVCCGCNEFKGVKHGRGATGETSTICPACALELLPEHLHAEYLRRRELEAQC